MQLTFFLTILALLAGGLLTLSFAPFNLSALALLSPMLLLLTWLNTSPGRAFWRGWVFGLGFFGTGVYWIYISIHTYGNTPWWGAVGLTAAMVSILSLYIGLNGYLLKRFFSASHFTQFVLAFPALWVLLEWLRSWFLSGFPWLLVGYSQLNTPLRGYAPILGVYGVSLLLVLSSGTLFYIGIQLYQRAYKKIVGLLFLILAIWSVGGWLSKIAWTTPIEKKIQVSLVQGNIPQELKWTSNQVMPTLVRYMSLTRPHWDSQLIIWPEAAVPLPMQLAKEFIDALTIEAQKHKTTVITGIPIKANHQDSYYNGVITMGEGQGIYTKKQLVPFGEYVPFHDWLGRIMDLLQVPMSDFIPGAKTQSPLLVNGIKIAAFVCYEIAYPELVLTKDDTIGLILTISNDAWFGRSIAQAQHAEMAQMRALELGRPILFVGNDGITAIINSRGEIQSRIPQYETAVLTDTVTATNGKTPWQYSAMYPLYCLVLVFLGVAYKRREKKC